MQQKKRSYSDELKSEAVKMVNEQGLSQQEAGRRLSIPKGTIARIELPEPDETLV